MRELAGRPEVAGFSVTDRVHSDQDPVTMAIYVRQHSGSHSSIGQARIGASMISGLALFIVWTVRPRRRRASA